MTPARSQLLQTLAQFGKENDQHATQRDQRMLNITPDTGSFLSLLLKATQASTVLEIGTSNGYSTIWLADAVEPTSGHVTTLEMSETKAELARANFEQASVSALISLRVGKAEDCFPTFSTSSFDFIFLDSDRHQYVAWWPQLLAILKPGGLLVVDNAVSHAHELVAFTELVEQTPNVETSLVPVGKGELLIWKTGKSESKSVAADRP